VKKYARKKKYLIQNPQEAVTYLRTASPSYKSHIYQFYCDPSSVLGVLSLRFESEEDAKEVEADAALGILEDVSKDLRYKNRMLKRFGFPYMYDFDVEEVFRKCDKLVGKSLELSLMDGMSTQKVLKVLVYFESTSLKTAVLDLLEDEGDALKRVYRHAKNLVYLLKIAHAVFDASLRESLYNSLAPLLCKERASVLFYVQSRAYQTLLWDMDFFLREKSGFYLSESAEMPIRFFVKKFLKKERFCLAQQLKKALD
jgi:hypothetical protein